MKTLYFAAFLCTAGLVGACGDDTSDDDRVNDESGNEPDSSKPADAASDSGKGKDASVELDAKVSPLDSALAASSGEWAIYSNPYTDGAVNPAGAVKGSALATKTAAGGMRLKLTVTGLAPARAFGSHVHKLACDNMMAGGHYQHTAASPADASADPKFANDENEVWLDFTSDASGKATVEADVDFVPRIGEAKAIVIHDHTTAVGGTAGPKLACINIVF